MNQQPIEKLLSVTGYSAYKLVILASQRATELAEGLPPLVEGVGGEKPTIIALNEIAEGKVGLRIESGKKKKGPDSDEKS